MSKAHTDEDKLGGMLTEIFQRLRDLESAQAIVVPLFPADPSSPRNGQIWVNTSSNQLKVRVGGTTKLVNLA